MGIYFRDILLIRISRGANNCGQHSLEKNIYFIMRFSPHSQLFYFNDRLEFCEFIEWKIKRINNADLFSQPPLLIFIKGANISGGHCIYIYVCVCVCVCVWDQSHYYKRNCLHWKSCTRSVDKNYNTKQLLTTLYFPSECSKIILFTNAMCVLITKYFYSLYSMWCFLSLNEITYLIYKYKTAVLKENNLRRRYFSKHVQQHAIFERKMNSST